MQRPRTRYARSPGRDRPQVAVAGGTAEHLRTAVRDGGGDVVEAGDATAVVWADPRDAQGLRDLLDHHPHLDWVQLPFAGIEPFLGVLDHDRTWTCGKGVYADPVAEMALGLALAGLRNLGPYANASTWTPPVGTNLLGARVCVLGGGEITASFLRLLEPFGCDVTVVRRSPAPVPGARRVVATADLHAAVEGADLLVLALALTAETEGIVDAEVLARLADGACVVNVARGRHIVTDDLVGALRSGSLGSAGLDVTDPEPLPDGHPLWSMPNAVITPHTANTPAMGAPLLAARVRENVRRRAEGRDLLGLVDVDAGY